MAFRQIRFTDSDESGAEASTLSGTVDGLTYVMHADQDAKLIGLYAGQLEAQVRSLEALLRSADPNMRGVQKRLRN